MLTIRRTLKWLAAMALASAVGTLPSCGTMDGGMHLIEPPSEVVTT